VYSYHSSRTASEAGFLQFISAVVGYDTGIGHNLTSCTTDIQVFRISFPELVDANLVLIDTPGFDDAERSDARILEMISDCLNNL
jgi:hypothetical protein